MTTVTNTIVKPNGNPRESASVVVTLSWDTDSAFVPSSDSDDVTILGEVKTMTDNDGIWTLDLISNEDILPANSVYKVSESQGDDTNIYYISVPAEAATPVENWVGDILAAKPSWEE